MNDYAKLGLLKKEKENKLNKFSDKLSGPISGNTTERIHKNLKESNLKI